MTTTPPTASPDTFVLSLPDRWREVPTDPDALAESVRAGGRSHGRPESVELRRLVVLLRRMAEHAQDAGLVFAAALTEELTIDEGEDDEPETEPYLVGAFAWLVTRRASELGVGLLSFAQLQAAVEPEPTASGNRRLERPRVLDLPGGPALRELTTRVVHDAGLDQPVEVFECRYHILIGAGEGLAVLGFASPNVELADELVDLFHAVASTFDLVSA
jgi:hypothetical protein